MIMRSVMTNNSDTAQADEERAEDEDIERKNTDPQGSQGTTDI